jgi:alkylation response protein AidB-like acyl-CoA dehydrogenase
MHLALTEEQEMIAETAIEFMREKSPVSRFRELRDAGDETGFSKSLWKEMAELGWVGMLFPEAFGGSDMSMADLITVLEPAGANLAPEPFLSTVLLAGQALLLAGSEEQKKTWLNPLVEGDVCLALGAQESHSRYSLSKLATRAERKGKAYVLTGQKIQVLDGHVADAIIVSARTSGEDPSEEGISLFIVPSDAPGLTRTRQYRVDCRGAAIIELDAVVVDESARIGDEGAGFLLLNRVFDRATVGLSAEMLGGMNRALELSLAHMKEREQFGVKIGSYQALQHRATRLFMEIELCRASVMAAARSIDEDDVKDKDKNKAAQMVSLAKARCSDAYVLVANEAVQFFGGVGVTDEYDVGFYLKRARAAELSFGDAAFHRDRWATLRGY